MLGEHDARSLSIIVPILNERKNLASLLRHLATINAAQTILVDGGSTDGGDVWLQSNWHDESAGRLLVRSKIGRARQMNRGSQFARTDMLLFLHADTRLPLSAALEVSTARNQNYFWGRFDVEFAPASRINFPMAIIANFMNIRSRLTSIATGDQGIFVDRSLFIEIGGFPLLPLMEDVALSKLLKRQGVPFCSSLKVKTSARRWQQAGVLRTVLLMWAFRLAFFLGVDPLRLAHYYKNVREK